MRRANGIGAATRSAVRRGVRVALVILLFAGRVGLTGQSTYMLRGIVQDAATDLPLGDVHVAVKNTELGAVSDAGGHFTIRLSRAEDVVLHLSRVGYAERELSIGVGERSLSGPVVLGLVPTAVDLPEAIINRPEPEVVMQRDDLHVGDHLVNDEGVWVLTYDRPKLLHRADEQGRQVFRDARLYLLDTAFAECCSVRLPTEVCRLQQDAHHRVIVEGVHCAWVVVRRGEQLELEELDLRTLKEQVLPWTDTIPGQLLGSDHDPTFPAFNHIAFVLADQDQHVVCAVQDDFRMELFRSQYKYMSGHDKVVAMDLALETGVDAEIIAGYMTGFHKSLYFRPPYAPLFVVRDTLCVFDHHQHRIRRFLADRTEVAPVAIAYHRDRRWTARLLQDRRSGAVYALFARDARTWLREVDTRTGDLGPEQVLDDPFPEVVKVHGDHAYFIYRRSGSLQHRTLYRQRIH